MNKFKSNDVYFRTINQNDEKKMNEINYEGSRTSNKSLELHDVFEFIMYHFLKNKPIKY